MTVRFLIDSPNSKCELKKNPILETNAAGNGFGLHVWLFPHLNRGALGYSRGGLCYLVSR